MAAVNWVPSSTSESDIPSGALRAGTDLGGWVTYAGRAYHAGDLIPAKVIPDKNECYISYDGQEIAKSDYEVLVPLAMVSWVHSQNGNVPSGAVQVGRTSDGEALYYGRVDIHGCTIPGKIHPSHSVLYYPYDGKEESSSEYEVLVISD